MPTFKVAWIVELEADSIQEAAEQAREIQLDEESIATHFLIHDLETNTRHSVDLMVMNHEVH